MNANHIANDFMKDTYMNFSQLQCLVTIIEMGSFTEAALMLGLKQPTVSQALSDLERELGVTLLERNRKGMTTLTTIGHSVLPHVRALLAQAEAIQQEAKAAQSQTSGKLRLGVVHSLCPDRLASIVTRFRVLYPDRKVEILEGTMHEVAEWIGCGIIDVGVVLHPAKGLESTLMTTDELCVLVPTGHRLHAKAAIAPRELREEGWIMAKAECAFQLMEMAGLEPSRRRPQFRYQASESTTILAMIREGLGITLLPRMMLPKNLDGVIALPLDPPQPLLIGLARRKQEIAPRGAELFVQTAVAWMQEQTSLLPTPGHGKINA